ncbi:hypothetical protein LEP1GSC024_1312 [Leptospira noguchii str. 2001034031]|uniref:Uncharacterized protein n=1 Tax=Leptospira noguchii str. 2001034031 TaxID=1193053 RepID=M6Y4B1_9LEPT|nr:hypothetical protein LEP1GSC024_1312 [Leptospira noguchii str. 2001034031]
MSLLFAPIFLRRTHVKKRFKKTKVSLKRIAFAYFRFFLY